ncbi:MAG TPA: DUF4416 family protein [Lacipirellulaceae bacterium]|nr:DUF4416 family protein [Lacipirellulaceae bacterium]
MGEIHAPASVLLVIAVSTRHEAALEWARKRCTDGYGPIALSSQLFDFTETDYYTATMGRNLKKQFIAFEQLIDPALLASIKCQTNNWEAEYAALGRHAEPRPLNLDPGYLTPAKLVLASTKDHAHRVYLRDGIFAEVTLIYRKRHWQPLEWTYPDYRRDDYQRFYTQCREWLLNCGPRTGGVE